MFHKNVSGLVFRQKAFCLCRKNDAGIKFPGKRLKTGRQVDRIPHQQVGQPVRAADIGGQNLAMVTCYNGRGIGPGTVFGKLLAHYMMGGASKDILLPVSPITPVSMRLLRGFFYEAGSRLYHLAQRRI